MNTKGSGAVSEAFLDTALTVCKRMLNVPQIEAILREMDGMPQDVFNPFDSHSRLQALVNKCKTQDDLLYVGQALKVLAVRQELTALSVAEIRGTGPDGGKGLVDLLLYKRAVKQAAMKKAEAILPTLQTQSRGCGAWSSTRPPTTAHGRGQTATRQTWHGERGAPRQRSSG